MRENVNLIPAEIISERQIASKKTFALSVLIAVLILIAAIVGVKLSRIGSLKKDLHAAMMKRDALKKDLSNLTGEVSLISNRLKVYEENEKRLQAAQDLLKNSILWSDIVRETSLIVPARVYLTMIESEGEKNGSEKKLRFVGISPTQTWITDFILSLEKSYYFSDVSLVYAQRDSEKKGDIRFEIKGTLKRH